MKPTKSLVILMALALCLSASAYAQHTFASPEDFPAPAVWTANIGQQLQQSLTSPVEEIRNSALEQVNYFVQFHAGIDLTAAVPTLVDIYKNDPSHTNRRASVAALHAIGDEGGMQQLGLHVVPQDKQIQAMVLSAVLDHYGPEYFEPDYMIDLVSAVQNYYR